MKHGFTVQKQEKAVDFLCRMLPAVPRATVKAQMRRGEVRVNGHKLKADETLSAGDRAEIFLPAGLPDAPVKIVYEDDAVIVADKPAHTESETEFAARLCKATGGDVFPVHRLDVNTTGVIVYAKTQEARRAFVEAFRAGEVHKTYAARVFGCPREDSGIWRAYLKKNADTAFCTVSATPQEGSLEIVTTFEVVRRGAQSVLSLHPITGRTHQLRAHAAFMGVPVVGDDKYGNRMQNRAAGAKRQMLRAVEIAFGALPPPLSYLSGRVFSVETGQDIECGLKKFDNRVNN